MVRNSLINISATPRNVLLILRWKRQVFPLSWSCPVHLGTTAKQSAGTGMTSGTFTIGRSSRMWRNWMKNWKYALPGATASRCERLAGKVRWSFWKKSWPQPNGFGVGCKPNSSYDVFVSQPVIYHIENFLLVDGSHLFTSQTVHKVFCPFL